MVAHNKLTSLSAVRGVDSRYLTTYFKKENRRQIKTGEKRRPVPEVPAAIYKRFIFNLLLMFPFNVNITINPSYFLLLETIFFDKSFCLRLQVETTKFGPIDRTSLFVLRLSLSAQLSMFDLNMETEFGLRKIVFKEGAVDMSKIRIVISLYHCHKNINLINLRRYEFHQHRMKRECAYKC
jgi:hypothetical protein